MRPDAKDISALVGVVLLAAGAFLVYAPLGLIVPGVFLIWLGVWRRRGDH